MKTVQRMAENRTDKATVVYPAEIGRGLWSLDHPPSTVGLKLLLVAVSALGEAVADDVLHDVPVSVLRAVPGVAGMGRDDLLGVLRSLVMASASLDLPDAKRPGRGSVAVGALVSYAEIDYAETGVLACRLRFGDVFRKMLAASELFAVIDRALALELRSRYSVLLYQFIATHWRKKHVRQIKLPLAQLRGLFAVDPSAYPQFKSFNQRVLSPAVSEISEKSDYSLTAKPYFEGSRAVAGVVLSWDAKAAKPAKSAPGAASPAQPRKPASGKASAGNSAPRKLASPSERLAALADHIKARRVYALRDIRPNDARALLASGAVAPDDLRACQINV